MPTSLSINERERFLYGDAAGDGKGDMLRIHAIKAEQANSILFSWLSGGTSEVRLKDALPIERGGTGGTTAQRGRLNMGIFVNTNNELMFGSKAVSLYEGAILDHDGSVKPGYKKVGLGHYEISGISGFALNGFKYCLPKDELGNVLCSCVISFENNVATVRVYEVFMYVRGVMDIDLENPMDIPSQRCIDISVK